MIIVYFRKNTLKCVVIYFITKKEKPGQVAKNAGLSSKTGNRLISLIFFGISNIHEVKDKWNYFQVSGGIGGIEYLIREIG